MLQDIHDKYKIQSGSRPGPRPGPRIGRPGTTLMWKTINGVNVMFDQVIVNLKEREEAGIMPPKFVFPHAIESSGNILKGMPFENSGNKSAL